MDPPCTLKRCTYQISWELASDWLAASDGQVGNEENDVWDDVDDEAVVGDGRTSLAPVARDNVLRAVKVFDRWGQAEGRNERGGDCKLQTKS